MKQLVERIAERNYWSTEKARQELSKYIRKIGNSLLDDLDAAIYYKKQAVRALNLDTADCNELMDAVDNYLNN